MRLFCNIRHNNTNANTNVHLGECSLNNWGIITFIFNSVPEEFLFILSTFFLVGRKKIDKNDLIKILVTTLITAAVTILVRKFSSVLPIISLIQIFVFIASYKVILKLKWLEASLGFLVTIVLYSMMEYLNLIIMQSVFGITLADTYIKEYILVLITIPQRIIQALSVFVLYKIPITLINVNGIQKVTKQLVGKITVLSLYLVIVFIFAIINLKHYLLDMTIDEIRADMSNIVMNIVLVLMIGVMSLYLARKSVNSINKEINRRDIILVWVKKLVETHKNDINEITRSIDEAIINNLNKQKGGKL